MALPVFGINCGETSPRSSSSSSSPFSYTSSGCLTEPPKGDATLRIVPGSDNNIQPYACALTYPGATAFDFSCYYFNGGPFILGSPRTYTTDSPPPYDHVSYTRILGRFPTSNIQVYLFGDHGNISKPPTIVGSNFNWVDTGSRFCTESWVVNPQTPRHIASLMYPGPVIFDAPDTARNYCAVGAPFTVMLVYSGMGYQGTPTPQLLNAGGYTINSVIHPIDLDLLNNNYRIPGPGEEVPEDSIFATRDEWLEYPPFTNSGPPFIGNPLYPTGSYYKIFQISFFEEEVLPDLFFPNGYPDYNSPIVVCLPSGVINPPYFRFNWFGNPEL